MGKFKRVFRKLADPRAANARHDLGDAGRCVRGGAGRCQVVLGDGLFRGGEGSSVPELLLPGAWHSQPRHVQSGVPPARPEASRRLSAVHGGVSKANGIELRGVVAIDGKALRGAYGRGRAATPCIWSMSGRRKPGWPSLSGSRPAATRPKVRWSRSGCSRSKAASSPAMRCIAAATSRPVLARGGRYVLALKGNQSGLFEAEGPRFARGGKRGVARPRTIHSRSPRGAAGRTFAAPAWPQATVSRSCCLGPHHIAQTMAWRRADVGRAILPALAILPAKRVLQGVRSHWSIENRLHWVLDVVFDEDPARVRKDHGPEPRILRKLALNSFATPMPTHPSENQARRMGKCLPPRAPRPSAIALRWRGEGKLDLTSAASARRGRR